MKRDLLAEAWIRLLAAVLVVLVAVVLVAAAGCEEKIYEVDLRPRRDKIERRLTLRRQDLRDHSKESLSKDDLAELGRIARPTRPKRRAFPGRKPRSPARSAACFLHDIGGDGHYVHWESPLGRVSIYVERFRGNDDIHSSLDARRKAVDSLVDLLVGWFESELHGESDWPPLRAFLDTQFRTDLQNLSLLVWSTNVRDIVESTDALAEVAFRAAQYCVERKYASYEEAPVLIREFQDATQRKNATALFARIRRLIVSRVKDGSERHGNGCPASWPTPIQCPRRGSAISCTRPTSSSTRRMSRSRSSNGLELRRPQSLRLGGNKNPRMSSWDNFTYGHFRSATICCPT